MSRIARRLGGTAVRRRRHRRFALVALVLVGVAAVLIVAGSGDDDRRATAGTTTTAAPDDDPVERICRENAREIAVARSALLDDNDAPGAVEGFLGDAFVDLARDRSAAIRAVQPPPGPELLAVLDEFDAVVDAVESDPTIGVGSNPFAAVDGRWRALGLGGCAMGGGTVADDG